MKKRLWLLVICAGLSACSAWSKVEKPAFTAQDKSYSADLPVGWVRLLVGRTGNDVFVTYDGPKIERIEIARHANKEAFPKIKKSANDDMLAFELAELMIAELKTDKTLANLEVVNNSPAMVSDHPGFKLELRVKNNKGVEFEMLVYGVSGKDNFYTLSYQAPRVHYFNKYTSVFEKTVESFHIL